MKRYSLKHEFNITEEDGKPVKNCSVQIYLCEHGIEKTRIMDLLTGITDSYNRFLGEEAEEQSNGALGNSGNNIRKGWFRW